MQTVCKYSLALTDEQEVELPFGTRILSVEEQYDGIVLYALVNTQQTKKIPYRIYIHGTGHNVTTVGDFIGTVKMAGGRLMFHVFIELVV